ncbi:hypothetical protein [Microvirga sp. Mcv34]|uniref:hypothetical protein n=1 Tax=Microvirga sp. Mcv34 TaxID=2926016 RepID=UPI0021C8B18A|nr:hypothetical protein [Microvirga sp. Mcv34]
MKKALATAAALSLIIVTASGAWAQGNKTGFSSDTGQGNLNNENYKDNPGSVEVSGPKGQIDKGNTDCNNCTSSGPGNGNNR